MKNTYKIYIYIKGGNSHNSWEPVERLTGKNFFLSFHPLYLIVTKKVKKEIATTKIIMMSSHEPSSIMGH
jgi:hypothetical protein